MTVGDKQIDPTVVVVVKKLRAPTNVRQTHGRDFRCVRKIRKRILAVVMIERVVFVGEVGNEDVELARSSSSTGGCSRADRYASVAIERR